MLFAPQLLAAMGAARTDLLPGDALKAELGDTRLRENLRADSAKQGTDTAAEKKKAEETATKSKLEKTHLSNGNNAMHEAQAIRQQIQIATGAERSALLAKMNADYQTAITEYQEALKNTTIADENRIADVGLLRMIRNGLIDEQKAADMLVQDKNLPVILSNLGMAYSGVGDYQNAIPMLQEATLSKPEPGTYMQLGTDFAEVGKFPEASATCGKIAAPDPTATDVQAACYRNIAVVMMNQGKLADAVVPLQKATQLNPGNAPAWKLLGDALSSTMTTRGENGRLVYVIPPGTIDAYQKYLQLEPNGQYAGEVKAVLDGFAQLTKGSS
ncbi:MAG TPA: tetratricopeptide repeat protein [Candidatus Acidoferrales bacterium]|nr:tetratricopeptide repeat protein [Candidatus Acidoferrales bacterium]